MYVFLAMSEFCYHMDQKSPFSGTLKMNPRVERRVRFRSLPTYTCFLICS